MSILEFSVHVQHPGEENPTLRLACKLAQRLQAHLDGIHAAVLPTAAFAVPEAVTVQVMEAERSRHIAEGKAEWWQKTLDAYHLQGNWRVGEGDISQVLCLAAASSHLLIMERSIDTEDALPGFGTTSQTVFAANHPVLVIPSDTALAETGRRVLVAWNGSLEATRALAGSIPILAKAEHVWILDGQTNSGPDGLAWLPPLDLAGWCSRHGIPAELRHFEPVKSTAVELLQFSDNVHADLIVLGAWGHSRLAEMVLGGVTRSLLREAQLPMLMAH